MTDQDTPPPEDDLLYDAWVLLANAAYWDQTDLVNRDAWLLARERWRDRWHETLPDMREEATKKAEALEHALAGDDMNCRHCGDPIIRHAGRTHDSWAHKLDKGILTRCQGNVPFYGYDAAPDDGKPCECWACERYGDPQATVNTIVSDQALSENTAEPKMMVGIWPSKAGEGTHDLTEGETDGDQ